MSATINRPSVSEAVERLPDGSFILSARGRAWIVEAAAGGYPPELLAEFVSLLIGWAGLSGEKQGMRGSQPVLPQRPPLEEYEQFHRPVPPPTQRPPRNLLINESSQRVVGYGAE